MRGKDKTTVSWDIIAEKRPGTCPLERGCQNQLTKLVVLIESLLLSNFEALSLGGSEIIVVVGHCLQI